MNLPSNKNKPPFRILIVEDDAEMRSLLADELSEDGYDVFQAKDGSEASLMVVDEGFDLVVTDMKMPKMGGLELLSLVKGVSPDIPVIVISAFGDNQAWGEAKERGSFRFMTKPFKISEFKEAVKKGLEMKLI